MLPFATAMGTVPEPCTVAGIPLLPFCLGHHLLFKRMGLPFAGSPLADAGWEDVMAGMAICSRSYEESVSTILDGKWMGLIRAMGRSMRGPWWNRRRLDLDASEELFRAYVADGQKRPPVFRHKIKNGVDLSAPWELILKCRLVMAGFREADVLNKYLPSVWYDYYTVLELNQAANLLDSKNWKKIFCTEDDRRKEEQAEKLCPDAYRGEVEQ